MGSDLPMKKAFSVGVISDEDKLEGMDNLGEFEESMPVNKDPLKPYIHSEKTNPF